MRPCRNTCASATKSKDARAFKDPDSQPLMLHVFDSIMMYFAHQKDHPVYKNLFSPALQSSWALVLPESLQRLEQTFGLSECLPANSNWHDQCLKLHLGKCCYLSLHLIAPNYLLRTRSLKKDLELDSSLIATLPAAVPKAIFNQTSFSVPAKKTRNN